MVQSAVARDDYDRTVVLTGVNTNFTLYDEESLTEEFRQEGEILAINVQRQQVTITYSLPEVARKVAGRYDNGWLARTDGSHGRSIKTTLLSGPAHSTSSTGPAPRPPACRDRDDNPGNN